MIYYNDVSAFFVIYYNVSAFFVIYYNDVSTFFVIYYNDVSAFFVIYYNDVSAFFVIYYNDVSAFFVIYYNDVSAFFVIYYNDVSRQPFYFHTEIAGDILNDTDRHTLSKQVPCFLHTTWGYSSESDRVDQCYQLSYRAWERGKRSFITNKSDHPGNCLSATLYSKILYMQHR